jgi:two-component system, sensor histidine kinase and response regulator
LVVEDNAVNQQLAARLLEKQGHQVALAGNGREALVKLDDAGGADFDLVLMDVQMPELDGLEATALIRKQEVATGKHLPIVAMTAHAMKGDRERCLAAGMDSYVSKPIHPEQLFTALHEVLGSTHEHFAGPETKPAPCGLIDNAALLARFEGDADLLSEMAELFLKSYPKLLEEIQLAVDRKDAPALERAAHTLKGSVSNFAARDAFDAAMELEKMATRGDLTRAERACQELAKNLECLKPVLEVFIKGIAP